MSLVSSRSSREHAVKSDRLRVLLAGKHELACALLELLRNCPDVDLAVVPARSERSDSTRASIKRLVEGTEIGLTDFGEGPALAGAIDAFKPDLVLSAGFDRILKADVIASVPCALNIHFGELPRYRGSFSIPWAILNAEPSIGITLHALDPSIDGGPIIAQSKIDNHPRFSCREIYEVAVEEGVGLTECFLSRWREGEGVASVPQTEELATYYPPQFPNDFRVPWRQTARYVRDYIRASHFPPLPGATSNIKGNEVEFLWPVGVSYRLPSEKVGEVVRTASGTAVATLNGYVLPTEVLVDGRRRPFDQFCEELRLLGARFHV
ncbi:MAG: formyltransferase family protein [Hyphomonadaceae bacterium]